MCPVDDDADHESAEEYPLPADHWINTPLGKEGNYKSLLHLGLETGNVDIGKMDKICIILAREYIKTFVVF